MNKEEFLELEIKDQIEHINQRTKEGLKVSEVAQEIGLGDKTLRTKIKKAGYTFDRVDRAYKLDSDFSVTNDIKGEEDKSHTNVIEKGESDNSHTSVADKKEEGDKSHTKVTKKVKRPEDNSHTNVFSKEDIGVLKDIINKAGDIKEMIEAYSRDDKSHSKDIDIELPEREETRTTIRVNAGAWEEFEGFTNKHSEYKKKDLLSMALLEYIKNHS